jgi:hypothetical protein
MWIYKDQELTAEMVPMTAIGFLYMITEIATGRKYIGRKLLTKPAYRMVNKKKKKYRKSSDWETYWSSSPMLLEAIQEKGENAFKREVLCFANSKSTLSYMEECFQYQLGVLESDEWYNSNIRSRMFRRAIYGKEDVAEFRKILPRVTY